MRNCTCAKLHKIVLVTNFLTKNSKNIVLRLKIIKKSPFYKKIIKKIAHKNYNFIGDSLKISNFDYHYQNVENSAMAAIAMAGVPIVVEISN